MLTNSELPTLTGAALSAAVTPQGSFDAVVDVHQAAGLFAVAPDFDFVVAGERGLGDLAAQCGGGFFASAVVGAVDAVDVVVSGDAGLQAEVFAEVAAHALAEQFFPAVAVFGHGGVGVGFGECCHVGVHLFVGGVDAGGAGEEAPADVCVAGRDQQMGVDEY